MTVVMVEPARRGGALELALMLGPVQKGRVELRRWRDGRWLPARREPSRRLVRRVYALTADQRAALDQMGMALPGEGRAGR